MFFKQIETKSLAHYSYMIGDGDDLAVIDPMRDVSLYMEEARKAGMRIKYILETHRNEDYVIGSRELAKKLVQLYTYQTMKTLAMYMVKKLKRGLG